MSGRGKKHFKAQVAVGDGGTLRAIVQALEAVVAIVQALEAVETAFDVQARRLSMRNSLGDRRNSLGETQ